MDGSRSRSSEVSRGRTRRTSFSRARVPSQEDGSRPTPPSVNEWDQMYPPAGPTQPNVRPPTGRKDSSKSKRSRSSSRRDRFRGTTVDNALTSIGRGVRNLFGSKPKNLAGCPKHDLARCISCMTHLDINGKTSKDGTKIDTTHKVDEPVNVEITPVFGEGARFDPAHDLQLHAKLNVESTIQTQTRPPAHFTTPSRKWFTYCSTCGVTYLVGKTGKNVAADHPSHATTDLGQRTICVYVDAGVNENAEGTLVGDSSVFFGPKSSYNALSTGAYDLEHQQSIQISALRRALHLALTVLEQRKALVAKHAISNSHKYLWDMCTQFRLLILSRMEAVDSWLKLARDAMGQGQLDPRIEADLRKIDEDVMRLALQGIEVQFFPLPAFHAYEPEYEFFYERFI
ncbi:hypothetical protein PG994_006075 [Apiospora phragmitis]|uniref:Uncharacterized protein n=1 Tax=Apiospora phragmitis TaxID=2905665 RepID=A0ABR1VE09_9PEZI